MKTKTKWTKEIPKVEGWYWVKYKGKNGIIKCPAKLLRFGNQNEKWGMTTARNDFFGEWTKDKSLYFGEKIEEPK